MHVYAGGQTPVRGGLSGCSHHEALPQQRNHDGHVCWAWPLPMTHTEGFPPCPGAGRRDGAGGRRLPRDVQDEACGPCPAGRCVQDSQDRWLKIKHEEENLTVKEG